MSCYRPLPVLSLIEGLLRRQKHQFHVGQVSHLLVAVCHAIFAHRVVRGPQVGMQVVTGVQDELKSLVVYLVVLRAPNFEHVAIRVPVETKNVAIGVIPVRSEETLGILYRRRELVQILLRAVVDWDKLLKSLSIAMTINACGYLDVARVILELLVQVALDSEGEAEALVTEVKHV